MATITRRRAATPRTTTSVSRRISHKSLQLRVLFPEQTGTVNLSLSAAGSRVSFPEGTDRTAMADLMHAADLARIAKPEVLTNGQLFERLAELAEGSLTARAWADAVESLRAEFVAGLTTVTAWLATPMSDADRIRTRLQSLESGEVLVVHSIVEGVLVSTRQWDPTGRRFRLIPAQHATFVVRGVAGEGE